MRWCAASLDCGCRGASDCPEPTKVCEAMSDLYKLSCPFKDSCTATIGCQDTEDGRIMVKTWMAKHLARYHAAAWNAIIFDRMKQQVEMQEFLAHEMGLDRLALPAAPVDD